MDEVKQDQVPDGFCPYVGLQPYSEADQHYFFGREHESRIISSNLYAASLTILYGPSGAGKSSILRAGVIPRLRASPRTIVVIFDEWADKSPLDALKTSCLRTITAMQGRKAAQVDANLPLDEFLLSITQAFGSTVIVILDQFEEYFLYHPENEKDSTFDAEFARSVNREDIDANFLIALRDDALSKMDRFRARIQNMFGNALRLRPLDIASARDAIRKPLDVYGRQYPKEPHISVEDALVEKLIREVQVEKLIIGGTGQGIIEVAETRDSDVRIEAPFLQLVLTRLWQEEIHHLKSNIMRLETLNALGGAGRIVRTHMDAAMNTLSWEELETAADIFRYMITPSGTKIAYTIADLEYYAKPNRPIQPLLEKLAQGYVRILRAVTSPGEPGIVRYEIYHDVLAPAVLDWRARYENGELLLVHSQSSASLRSGLAQVSHFYKQLTSKRGLTFLLPAFVALLLASIFDFIPSQISLIARLILPLLLNSLLVSMQFDWVTRTMIARRRGLAFLITTAGGMGATLGLVFTLNMIRLIGLAISTPGDALSIFISMLIIAIFETTLALVIILLVAWITERLLKSYASGFYWSFVVIVVIEVVLTILRQPYGLIG